MHPALKEADRVMALPDADPASLSDAVLTDRYDALRVVWQATDGGTLELSDRLHVLHAEMTRRGIATEPRAPVRILVSNEWLARQIAADPDIEECEAGTLHPEAPTMTDSAER